jgi:SAM-dependent methyltransferase
MRIVEIGGGPGAAAKAIAHRIGDGHILMIDRSAKSIAQARQSAADEIKSGRMSIRHVAIEDFELLPDEDPFDLAFAIRVGALDGRHPELAKIALKRIAHALAPGGRLLIDGGNPLRELELPDA